MLCKGFFTDSKLTRSEGIQSNDQSIIPYFKFELDGLHHQFKLGLDF